MKNNITPEEIALIKSAKAGSELAFSKIFKRYKPFVEGVLLTYIKDEDEAKDIDVKIRSTLDSLGIKYVAVDGTLEGYDWIVNDILEHLKEPNLLQNETKILESK